jgi:hypothetical protein
VHQHICLQYVCYLLNHTYNSTINDVPLTRLTGTTDDISPLLRFHFWEPVYYFKSETSFPSESKEDLGNIIGISERCGNALTYKVLTADTGHTIYHVLRIPMMLIFAPACLQGSQTPTMKLLNPEVQHHTLWMNPDLLTLSHHHQYSIHKILLLWTNLSDGQTVRWTKTKSYHHSALEDHESKLEDNPTRIKFKLSLNNDQQEDIITYSKMLEYITKDKDSDITWKFRQIVSH